MLRRPLFAVVLVSLIGLAGCAQYNRLVGKEGPEPIDPIGLLAVMPIDADTTNPVVAADAGKVVTAEIYGVISDSPTWRFVPDLTVSDQMTELSPLDEPAVRALKLGKAVNADSVLFGEVSRFTERVGSEYGASSPAAVSISLKLVSVSRKKIVWHGEFNETQESLSENLLNFWQFWRGGPKWFSAREFAHLGVERLLEDLQSQY